MPTPEHHDALQPLWPVELQLPPPECIRRGRKRGRIERSVRQRVYARDGHRCVVCGRVADDWSADLGRDPIHRVWLTLDHIFPIRAGGCSHPHNLRTLCNQCNSRKGSIA